MMFNTCIVMKTKICLKLLKYFHVINFWRKSCEIEIWSDNKYFVFVWTIGNKYHVIAILLLLFSGDYLLVTPIITFYTLHKSMWNVLDLCGVNDVERDLLCNRRRIQLQKKLVIFIDFFSG